MNNIMKFILGLVIAVCMQQQLYCQSGVAGEKHYTFNNLVKSWVVLQEPGVKISIDSTQKVNGSYPTLLSFEKVSQANRSVIISRYIPIDIATNKIGVRINCKSNFKSDISLNVYCIDDEENVVNSDSVRITGCPDWKEFCLNINTHSAKELFFQIKGEFPPRDKRSIWGNKYKLLLDRIILKSTTMPVQSNKKDQHRSNGIQITNPVALSSDNDSCIDKISDFKNKKIIGLAEVVHGSETIHKSVCQIIRRAIEQRNCKLVLMELPFCATLEWNEFVQGNDSIDIEISVNKIKMLFSHQEMISLLKWMRQYNKKNSDKVRLFGIDLNANYAFYSRDFCYDAMKSRITDPILLKEVRDSVLNRLAKTKSIYCYVSGNKKLASVLGKGLHENLLYSLSVDIVQEEMGLNTNGSKFTMVGYFLKRDSLMFRNAAFLMDKYMSKNETKVILFAHFAHLNKLNTQMYNVSHRSLGNYLAMQWGSDFYVTAITVGKGEITSLDKNIGMGKNALPQMSSGSIEAACENTRMDYLFFKTDKMENKLYEIRFAGNRFLQSISSNMINPKRRIDAVIYKHK